MDHRHVEIFYGGSMDGDQIEVVNPSYELKIGKEIYICQDTFYVGIIKYHRMIFRGYSTVGQHK